MHKIPHLSGPQNRISLIDTLEKKHELTRVITENLCHYMNKTRQYRERNKYIFAFLEIYLSNFRNKKDVTT
jgi:hypothetical protein